MNRVSTPGRVLIIFSDVATSGVYQSGMQFVWSMNGIRLTGSLSTVARRRPSHPSKIQTTSYWWRCEPDAVVGVADLHEPDLRRVAAAAGRQLLDQRLLQQPAEPAVGVTGEVAGLRDPGRSQRQQARRVVLDHRADRHDRESLGPRRDQLLLHAERHVRLARTEDLERRRIARFDDLHVQPGRAVPALRPRQVDAVVVRVRRPVEDDGDLVQTGG